MYISPDVAATKSIVESCDAKLLWGGFIDPSTDNQCISDHCANHCEDEGA
jgi:hypothetical protein